MVLFASPVCTTCRRWDSIGTDPHLSVQLVADGVTFGTDPHLSVQLVADGVTFSTDPHLSVQLVADGIAFGTDPLFSNATAELARYTVLNILFIYERKEQLLLVWFGSKVCFVSP